MLWEEAQHWPNPIPTLVFFSLKGEVHYIITISPSIPNPSRSSGGCIKDSSLWMSSISLIFLFFLLLLLCFYYWCWFHWSISLTNLFKHQPLLYLSFSIYMYLSLSSFLFCFKAFFLIFWRLYFYFCSYVSYYFLKTVFLFCSCVS
jgi:hypothetical protein